jgi:DNA-directed RNA polymerase specialized sigma24 family protein
VSFTDGGAPVTGGSAAPVIGGTATCQASAATAAAHNIVATFSGTSGFAASTSAAVTQVVTSAACLSLAGCSLAGASLARAGLAGANLNGATLVGATVTATTNFSDVTWSNTTCPDATDSKADAGICTVHLQQPSASQCPAIQPGAGLSRRPARRPPRSGPEVPAGESPQGRGWRPGRRDYKEAASLGTTSGLRPNGPAPSDSAVGGREGMDAHQRPVTVTPTRAGSARPSARRGSPAMPDPLDLAERAGRLQADCQLRDALAAQGFAGPAYAVFEEDLASYGHRVMTAWLATGYIFTLCHQAGLKLRPTPILEADHEDLAQETVAAALAAFRRNGLQQGGWRPEGGATLKTCFTGTLCGQFANVWKQWLRTRAATTELPLEMLSAGSASSGPGPENTAVRRDEIRRGLAAIENERTRVAVVLAEDGYEHEEIAEILGLSVTARAVEGYLRRHRQHKAAGISEEDAGD